MRDLSTVKLKLGTFSIDQALRFVDTLIPHLKNTKMRIDFNQKWSLANMRCFARRFPHTHLDYYEEPLCTPPPFASIARANRP